MSELAQPFIEMAERIKLNAEQSFGGAFVILPPGEEAKPIELLMLNETKNAALFLSTLQTMVGMALQDIEDRERGADPFSRMR